MLTIAQIDYFKKYFDKARDSLLTDERFLKISPSDSKMAIDQAYFSILNNITNPKEYFDSIKPTGSYTVDILNSFGTYEGDIKMKEYGNIDSPDLIISIPTRNETYKIRRCVKSIIHEISKSKLKTLVFIIINNTSDDSLASVKSLLDEIELPNNLKILLFHSNIDINSLPKALNFAYTFITNKYSKLENSYFSTVDGDAIIINSEPESIFDLLIKDINDTGSIVVSGQSTDLRRNVTAFHNFANLSCRPEIVRVLKAKPYTHGGGGCVLLKYKDYPKDLLKNDDLGGISLSIYAHRDVDYEKLVHRDSTNWITKTIPHLMVSHPTRTNIIDWAVTYSNYAKFRAKAKVIVPLKTYELWESKRAESKIIQDDILYSLADRYFSLKTFAGYLLIKKYLYKEIIYNNPIDITFIKGLSPRAHNNV